MLIKIPYDTSYLTTECNERNIVAVLEPGEPNVDKTPEELVISALERPIGSSRLADLAKDKQKIVIISSDHTRPMPSRITIPLLLQEIRRGNPGADITILIATGLHRPPNSAELINRYGEEVVSKEKIVIHDADNQNSLIALGKLPSGATLLINRLAVEADLLVAEGFIEPHFFAGYSGGRKSILPGIAGRETIYYNHSALLIKQKTSRAGFLDTNKINRDMEYAAQTAKLAFILNVCLDSNKNICAAFAGEPVAAHRAGCEYLRELASVKRAPADIVIVSNGGYPLDQNLYQAVKGMSTAADNAKPGAVIICVAGCVDGMGSKNFFELTAGAESPEKLLKKILDTPPLETVMDQWQVQILAEILCKHKVILVSRNIDSETVSAMHMEHALTLEGALQRAFELKGKDAKITVIPNGVSIITED
ncbi:Lactate racemase [Moorella thermoacetica]|uniref:Lactate racemase n=1 Tax=Neomoorella thermoacetica TaxID=1525 RepID=A0AAC9HGJ7_NEOTH|nr:nickel-dependent lactate racemase [Moorella thermoacetica]AOQ23377.1 hypothetical protein Maut_00919 [Moorella thermoacetica]TYL09494.1 Lactate racemase [Moorella thermoacetica]